MDGQVLKERLSKLTNLTQMELAEKLNVSQQSFSQYFLAKDVKSGLLERLAEIEDNALHYYRVKTRDRRKDRAEMRIVIPPYAQPIAARYIDALHRRAFRFYRMYRNENDFVRAINLGLKEIGAELGIERLQFYAARHSWATIAAELDITFETISAALGHSIANPTTAIYINFNQRKVDEANRKVIDYVFS